MVKSINNDNSGSQKTIQNLGSSTSGSSVVEDVISITGTSSTLLDTSLYGTKIISIYGASNTMPSALFIIAKDSPTGTLVSATISQNTVSGTDLQLAWADNDAIRVSKTTTSCNGTYNYKIL
jgi:hypothetical protein